MSMDRKGFLLMELLVTLALLVILAPSLLGLLKVGADMMNLSGQQTTAFGLAQECLEGLRGCEWCSVAASDPQAVDGFPAYVREVEVADLNGEKFCLPVKEIKVTVCWESDACEHCVRLITWQAWR